MMKTLSALLAITILAGCAAGGGGYWNHAHGDRAQFQRDAAQCDYEAAVARTGSTGGAGVAVSMAQDLAAGAQRGELAAMCMRAKGYYFINR